MFQIKKAVAKVIANKRKNVWNTLEKHTEFFLNRIKKVKSNKHKAKVF